ncbi:MAG: pilus assembly protein [Planctomycetaceae bacterium]|nr:pilus assembly protein [Planctomycetaceae bacterium]
MQLRRSPRRSQDVDRRRGVVTVEFALTMPVALLLAFALVEFARVNMIRNTMDNAAYEGARAAIIPGGTAARSETAALAVLNAIGVSGASVNVDPPIIDDTTPDVEVTVTVPLGQNMWIVPTYFVSRDMTKSCKLTREYTGRTP